VSRSAQARPALVAAFGAASVLAIACGQSALLGQSARQVQISAASGGTLAAGPGDNASLAGFSLVFHPGDLSSDQTISVQLGTLPADLVTAGPSVEFDPFLALNHPADLTLPYSLGQGQLDDEVTIELQDGLGPPLRADRSVVTLDPQHHLVRAPLPRLGIVRAIAPRHCQQDADCGPAGFCEDHDGLCRPRLLPDGGMDPDSDGGSHHP
jgi:hypothetical protein